MDDNEDRPRLLGFGPVEPHHLTSTWIVRRGTTPQRLDDLGRRIDPDYRPGGEFIEATITGGPYGRTLGSCHIDTIHDAMQLLKFVRHDPEPGDPDDVIERWSPADGWVEYRTSN